MAITQNILDIVLQHGEENGALKVTKVVVTIGAMTQVVGECVRFYFEVMSKGTIAEGADLEIRDIPTRVKCPRCGDVFKGEDLIFICPRCQVASGDIVSGKELNVTSIVIENGEEADGNQGD
jgi:hydrogenase nickel incorporation protein HypA/HybF